MADAPAHRSFRQFALRHPGNYRRFADVEHVIESSLRCLIRCIEAGIARELEPEVLFANPDLSAVLAFDIRPLIEVVGQTALIADGLGVILERLTAY